MNHKIVSFYKAGMYSSVVDGQKKVFDFFNIPLEQVVFNETHHQAIENYVNTNDFDVLSILDVDSIPLHRDVFSEVHKQIDDNTIYGNAQNSNSFAYVGPNFLNFNKKVFDKIEYRNFSGGFFNNIEYDVAEMFSIVASRKGIKLNLSYPSHVIEPIWTCKHGKQFTFGIGTTYENGTFHCFQIRNHDRIKIFLDKCREVTGI